MFLTFSVHFDRYPTAAGGKLCNRFPATVSRKGIFKGKTNMKILVGYTGSDHSRQALTVAQKRARTMKAELHVLTSMPGSNEENPKQIRLNGHLKDVEMMCSACQIDCHVEIADSGRSAAADLIQYAKDHDIEEIVIGVRKRSNLGKMLLGSTAREIILNAPCPVLTIR